MQSNLFLHVEGRLPCVSFSHDESDEDAVCSSSVTRDYFLIWGMFELTIKESEGEKTHSTLALCARSFRPHLPFFACLQLLRFSLVQCFPLNLRKACGGGRLKLAEIVD